MTEPTSQWNEYKIEELGRVVTGHTPLKSVKEYYESNDYTWIKPTDIRKGERYVLETEEYYSQKAFEKFKNFLLPPLSTCVVTIGTVGEKICLTHKYCFSNQSINAIVPDRQKFDPMFVYYLLKYNLDQVAQRNPGTSSGRDHVSKSNISSIVVKAPSKQTQSKISAILARYDDLLENNARRIKILEEMAQAMYREWFVKFRFPGHEGVRMVESELGPVPEGWAVKNLFDIADVTYGFPFQSKLFTSNPTDKPVIRIRNILNDYTDNYTTEDATEKYLVKNGDILVGMDGDFHIGKWAGGEAYLNQRIVRFRSKHKISPYYLLLALENPIHYFDATITGTTVAHLSDKDLKSIRILIPDDTVMTKTNDLFDSLFNLEILLKIKNAELLCTRDLLLPKLISGKIDVSGLDIEIPEAEA